MTSATFCLSHYNYNCNNYNSYNYNCTSYNYNNYNYSSYNSYSSYNNTATTTAAANLFLIEAYRDNEFVDDR